MINHQAPYLVYISDLQLFRIGELSNLGSIRTQNSVADALKKDLKNSVLNDVLRSHTIRNTAQQLVKKSP